MKEEFTQNWPTLLDDQIAAVERVLRSGRINYWTGDEVRVFERSFAAFTGAKHAIALANGTVALELALRSLKIGPGDDVVVTSRSFVASAAAVSLVGATPVFADVDPDSQNVTAETIEDVLTRSTKAVLLVHLGGWPCEMDPIMELADARDLLVIEDCAQALGATYRGQPMGSWGHAAAWSFCQDKIMTTGGEGGMLTTDDDDLYERAWSYKDHGKNRRKMHGVPAGPSYKWVHDTIGTNWRMTEMQAAIGNTGLPSVPEWVERRRALATLLDDSFSSIDQIRTTVPPGHIGHAYYKYYAFLRPGKLSNDWSRDQLLEQLHQSNLPVYSGICGEIYREAAFQDAGFAPEKRHPVSRELAETAMMIPIHPFLSDDLVVELANAIAETVVGMEND